MKYVYCHGSKIQGSEALCARVACPECGCGFTYDKTDVIHEVDDGPIMHCPECKMPFFLEQRRVWLPKP